MTDSTPVQQLLGQHLHGRRRQLAEVADLAPYFAEDSDPTDLRVACEAAGLTAPAGFDWLRLLSLLLELLRRRRWGAPGATITVAEEDPE